MHNVNLPLLIDIPLENRTVLLRIDGDVPIEKGKIRDDFRLKAAIPTIEYCLEHKARLILLAHRGRPGGKFVPELSNELLADYYSSMLKEPVYLLTDLVAAKTVSRVQMFENLRFFPGEEKDELKFAKRLAKFGEIYVNDAFAVSHRKHASVSALPSVLPHAAGLGLVKEINELTSLIEAVEEPYVVILGGAKAADKSPILEEVIDRTQSILLGGLVAVTYLAAMGQPTGAHTIDRGQVKIAQRCIRKAHEKKITIAVPIDVVTQRKKVKKVTEIETTDLMLDIGPETQRQYDRIIHKANTIFWNGAMGKSEEIAFAKGTIAMAHSIGISGADIRIASGGDTVGAIHDYKLHRAFTFMSTGGGATLEYIAGRELPGIKVLHS